MPDDKNNKKERIDRALYLLAEIFVKELTNNLVETFQQVLKPCTIEEIEKAFHIWMTSYDNPMYDFFPRPNQILKIINKKSGPPIKARAQQQWRQVVSAVKNRGVHHPLKFSDPVTQNLISTQFRWSYLCEMAESNEDWEQRRWCEAFELAAELHEDLKEIGVPEKVRDLLDDIGSE